MCVPAPVPVCGRGCADLMVVVVVVVAAAAAAAAQPKVAVRGRRPGQGAPRGAWRLLARALLAGALAGSCGVGCAFRRSACDQGRWERVTVSPAACGELSMRRRRRRLRRCSRGGGQGCRRTVRRW